MTNIVRGNFQSAYLGFYMFKGFERRGHMHWALGEIIRRSWRDLKLHHHPLVIDSSPVRPTIISSCLPQDLAGEDPQGCQNLRRCRCGDATLGRQPQKTFAHLGRAHRAWVAMTSREKPCSRCDAPKGRYGRASLPENKLSVNKPLPLHSAPLSGYDSYFRFLPRGRDAGN